MVMVALLTVFWLSGFLLGVTVALLVVLFVIKGME